MPLCSEQKTTTEAIGAEKRMYPANGKSSY
jgi:hypothetical protein